MLKMFSKLFLPYLAGVINHSIATSSFPDERELSKVMSDLKKDDHFDKENYRIKSLLSNTSKIFQNIFFIQINDYIEPYFSRYPDRALEKSQYTALLDKNARKLKTSFTL